MLSFLGLSNIPIYLLISAGVVAAYFMWQSVIQENAILKQNQEILSQALKDSEKAITEITNNINKIQQETSKITKNNDRILKDNLTLINKLNKQLKTLAEHKPGLIETRINKGTKDSNRCLEIASGSPLTIQEKNAEKISEFNTICPSIANPNYIK